MTELVVKATAFAEAVSTVSHYLSARPVMPVLNSIRIEAGEEQLNLSVYDTETYCRVSMPRERPGPLFQPILLNGRALTEIARFLPAEDLVIAPHRSTVKLSCAEWDCTLPIIDLAEYPTTPEPPPARGVMPAVAFARAVAAVTVVTGRDDSVPTLTGVSMQLAADSIAFASTDTYRLSELVQPWKRLGARDTMNALVHGRSLAAIARTLNSAEDVVIGLDGEGDGGTRLVGFTHPRVSITTRLIEGTFYDYRKLFPTEFRCVATLDRRHLLESVRRVAAVMTSRGTALRVTMSGTGLRIALGTDDEGAASEMLRAVRYSPPPASEVEFGVNPQYLIDALQSFESSDIRFAVAGSLKPLLFFPPGSDAGQRHLVSSMRLPGERS